VKMNVAGSGTIRDYTVVAKAIQAAKFEITEVINGGAPGVVSLGRLGKAKQCNSPDASLLTGISMAALRARSATCRWQSMPKRLLPCGSARAGEARDPRQAITLSISNENC
jgi:hypothetical protein